MEATFIHCPKCAKVVLGDCKCDAPAEEKKKKKAPAAHK